MDPANQKRPVLPVRQATIVELHQDQRKGLNWNDATPRAVTHGLVDGFARCQLSGNDTFPHTVYILAPPGRGNA